MPNTSLREQEWTPRRELLPYLLGKRKVKKSETTKLDLFEAGLAAEINKGDTIQNAMTKMVRMALAAEFGPSLVKSKGAEHMVETIVAGILSDTELRRQALVIVDRFAK